MTVNSTTERIPPLKGISEAERDKYLLIATFLSGLIIFGVLVAFMHRKCRNTLIRTKNWIISKTVRHRLDFNRTSSGETRAVGMSIRDPASPVFSKEVYAPVVFYLGSSAETSSSSETRKEGRLRTTDIDHEDDSGISVISGSQNFPTSSVSKQCFAFNRDLNDNLTLTVKPSRVSRDPGVNSVRVLAPENPGKTSTNDKRQRLRRSSTVIDKMNFMNGYMPSSRDDDYTVISLTDDSESDGNHRNFKCRYDGEDVSFVNKAPKRHRSQYTNGLDNPAFYLNDKSKSASNIEIVCDRNVVIEKSDVRPLRKTYDNSRNSGKEPNPHFIKHHALVHAPQNVTTLQETYDKTKVHKRPENIKNKVTLKSIDKESQELYKRVVRERILDIISSDSCSSSVKSDQTFVRNNKQKSHALTNKMYSTTVV